MAADQRAGIRPQPTFGRRLDTAARLAFPTLVTILLMIGSVLPFGFAGAVALLPAVSLGSVWFWSWWWPPSMPPPAVFALGLLLDLLGYQPLGVGCLSLLLVHAVALRWRPLAPNGRLGWTWAGFVPVAAGAAALTWAVTAVFALRLIAPAPALFQAALTVALYPVLAIPLAAAHRGVADGERP